MIVVGDGGGADKLAVTGSVEMQLSEIVLEFPEGTDRLASHGTMPWRQCSRGQVPSPLLESSSLGCPSKFFATLIIKGQSCSKQTWGFSQKHWDHEISFRAEHRTKAFPLIRLDLDDDDESLQIR